MIAGYTGVISTIGELLEILKDRPLDAGVMVETDEGSTDLRLYLFESGAVSFEPPYEE